MELTPCTASITNINFEAILVFAFSKGNKHVYSSAGLSCHIYLTYLPLICPVPRSNYRPLPTSWTQQIGAISVMAKGLGCIMAVGMSMGVFPPRWVKPSWCEALPVPSAVQITPFQVEISKRRINWAAHRNKPQLQAIGGYVRAYSYCSHSMIRLHSSMQSSLL